MKQHLLHFKHKLNLPETVLSYADPGFNDPLPEQHEQQISASETTTTSSSSKPVVNETDVVPLVANLGCFVADQVRAALTETNPCCSAMHCQQPLTPSYYEDEGDSKHF